MYMVKKQLICIIGMKMKFIELDLAGAYLIEYRLLEDSRGYFCRSFCEEEFRKKGLKSQFLQSNISFSSFKGTLRGLHWQKPPFSEAKLLRCVRGAVWDVIVDLRPTSSTFSHWQAVELREGDGKSLYIPEEFAHGFYTLEESTELNYQHTEVYSPKSEAGILWKDPSIAIEWPGEPRYISERDQSHPLFGKHFENFSINHER